MAQRGSGDGTNRRCPRSSRRPKVVYVLGAHTEVLPASMGKDVCVEVTAAEAVERSSLGKQKTAIGTFE